MKITMYELLGLIKDGKPPKKIKYRDNIWEYTSTVIGKGYQYYSEFYQEWETLQKQVYIEECLNDEIEIIEEDTKLNKINLNYSVPYAIYDMKALRETLEEIIENQRTHEDRINELIDEVNKLK